MYRQVKMRLERRPELNHKFLQRFYSGANARMSDGGPLGGPFPWMVGNSEKNVFPMFETVSGGQGVGFTQYNGTRFFCKQWKMNYCIEPATGQNAVHARTITIYIVEAKIAYSDVVASTDSQPDRWLNSPDTGPVSFRKPDSSESFRIVRKITHVIKPYTIRQTFVNVMGDGILLTDNSFLARGSVVIPVNMQVGGDQNFLFRKPWFIWVHDSHKPSSIDIAAGDTIVMNAHFKMTFTDA